MTRITMLRSARAAEYSRPEFSRVYSAAKVAAIVNEYNIPEDKVTQFKAELDTAIAIFAASEHFAATRTDVSTKANARHLVQALKTAVRLLNEENMSPRLYDANLRLDPAPDGGGIYPPKYYGLKIPAVEALLRVAEAAVQFDGRPYIAAARRKDGVRYAARSLLRFWVMALGQKPTIFDRNAKESAALRFLLACLKPLDPQLKEATLRGLDQETSWLDDDDTWPEDEQPGSVGNDGTG